MNIENERKLFEEWAKSESLNISKFISRGDYLYKDTQRCWKAWQASANREGFVLVNKESMALQYQSIRMFNCGENYSEDIEEHICNIENMITGEQM